MNLNPLGVYEEKIHRTEDAYVEAIVDAVCAFLLQNGVLMTNEGETKLADAIRWYRKP